jgi:Methyltransferase domain
MVSRARGRVLEIGIGSGLNLPFYGGQVASVYGIDPAAALLRRASKQPAAAPELVQGSAEIIPFDNDVFDTVSDDVDAVYHTSSHDGASRHAARSSPGWSPVIRGARACAGPRGRMVAASPDTLLEMPRRWLSSQPQDR